MAEGREGVGQEDGLRPVEPATGTRQLRYRIAFFLTALVVLWIVVTLPFSVKSVVDDILGPSTGRVIQIKKVTPGTEPSTYAKLHLAFVSLDETQLLATASRVITVVRTAPGATVCCSSPSPPTPIRPPDCRHR